MLMRWFRRLLGWLGLIFVACVLCAVFAVWLTGALTEQSFTEVVRDSYRRYQLRQQQALLQATMGTQQESIRIDVTPGMSTVEIAQLLYEQGLIVDVDVFVLYTVVNQLDAQLEAGVYFLSQTMTIPEIATRLTDTNSSKITFRILAGWRIEEIAQAIDQTPAFTFSGADFLLATQQDLSDLADFKRLVGLTEGRTLEGFMLPNTYFIPPTATAQELRDILLQAFNNQMVTDGLYLKAHEQGMTLFEVVTLASIVEREAVHDDEQEMVASVYLNRLTNGMKLDADPTIQYAIGNTRNPATWWASITREDYTGILSPYNTYLSVGLPPSPITNPGISAIRAVLFAPSTDYLYFRARCDASGYHDFTRTYEEHLQSGCTG
ncbi:MAG: endolytic transglycosylase MltG [Phototrophicaceae bacterium]